MRSFPRVFLALLLSAATWPSSAETTDEFSSQAIGQATRTSGPTVVDQAKRNSAIQIAGMLEDRNFVAVAERHLSVNQPRIDLNTLFGDYLVTGANGARAASTFRSLNQRVSEYKGANVNGKLLELRLYTPENYVGRIDLKDLLVAYVPPGSSKTWTTIEAFDRSGLSHYLDARVAPTMPILITGINRREDLRIGVAVMNEALQAGGMQVSTTAPVAGDSDRNRTQYTENLEMTKLDHIRLENDQEPWILGQGEIYAVVSGIQPDQSKASLSVVEMPYADYDKRTYHPNQIVVTWNAYRYGIANVQLFEHDDNTNYKELAAGLMQGVNAALGALAPSYAIVGQIASAILRAMPQHWFSNDDDYVDSFYTLEKGRTYIDYRGAANNATATFTPFVASPDRWSLQKGGVAAQ